MERIRRSNWLCCSHRTGLIIFVVGKKRGLVSKKVMTVFHSKNGADPLTAPVHIRSGAFQKAIRYGTHHVSNRSVPDHIRHKNRA